MEKRYACLAGLFLLAGLVRADEPALRPSARLLFKQPELTRAGTCVMYREGGSGWIFTDPEFWLKGTVLATEVKTRRLERCPQVPGKSVEQYSREEFNRLALAHPCLGSDDQAHDEQVGVVRIQVEDWETPWGKRAANAGRLYQGHFVDQALRRDMQLEIEADLLGACL